MKHIEVSRKINLSKPVKPEELKKSLLNCIENAIQVEDVGEADDHFQIVGTTGSPTGMTRHAKVNLTAKIALDSKDKTARIIVSGYAHAARSLTVLYSIAFLFLLFVGLLPGFVETNAENSSALDALFFLIFGIFIVFDTNSKIALTKQYLETALESLDTTYG